MIELNHLRKEIDEVDDLLIELLKKRIEISKKIGKIKKNNGLEIYDSKRESEIILRYTKNEDDENKKYIESFLKNIMNISKEVQNK